MREFIDEETLKQDNILMGHNIPTYLKLLDAFDSGADRVCVTQATGTGKSYLAFQWLYDNVLKTDGKTALVLDPLWSITRQFESIYHDRYYSELAEYFQSLRDSVIPYDGRITFSHYDTLKRIPHEQLLQCHFDYIVLDEFHRVGAAGRNAAVQTLLNANPDAKVLGLSATPIRYLDRMRDMGKELFGDNVISGTSLPQAIESGILKSPDYVLGVFSYDKTIQRIENEILSIRDDTLRSGFLHDLKKIKKRASSADGLDKLLARKIQNKSSKCIVFCTDTSQMSQIRNQINTGLFSGVNSNVHVYSISYLDGWQRAQQTINNYIADNTTALKIMLAVDMFNEGMHIPGVDVGLMFRPTKSPNIYLQQLGRLLSVSDTQSTPIVFDIVDNLQNVTDIFDAFDMHDNLTGESNKDIFDTLPFTIDSNDIELTKFLREFESIVTYATASQAEWLSCANRYSAQFGNLDAPYSFVDASTDLKFGAWLDRVRRNYIQNSANLDGDLVQKLQAIDPEVFLYSREYNKQKEEHEVLLGLEDYTNRFGTIPVPYNAVSGANPKCRMGAILARIKFEKRVADETFIQDILSINPHALDTRKDTKAVDIRKNIEGLRAYTEQNGPGMIPARALSPLDPSVRIGIWLQNIKRGTTHIDDAVRDEILSINPSALSSIQESQKSIDILGLESLKSYTEIHGPVAIPARTQSPVDPTFNLGNWIQTIRRGFRTTASDELVEEILSINPHALDSRKQTRAGREIRIVDGIRAYTAMHGQVKIPAKAVSPLDSNVRIGNFISHVNYGDKKISDDLRDEILDINPNAFGIS